MGTLPSATDTLISISGLIERYFGVFLIFAVISPVLLVVGIIRILVVEKPSRFAKISKFLSSLFLKEKSYLCGMEMVRRKQYRTVILLVGIFTSLLVFTNVFLNSFSRYEIMIDNMDVGSDVAVLYNNEDMSIVNTSEIDLLESQLKSYTTSDNETLINQVLTSYTEMTSDEYNSEKIYTDIEGYLDIIQEGDKKLPSRDFVSKIEDVIDYNKDPLNTIPGVIVNSAFLTLNNLEIDDLYSFTHSFFNYSSMEIQNETISVKIIVSINVMPGFYVFSGQLSFSYRERMIIDISSVNQDKNLLHGIDILQMIDIDTDVEDDPEVLEGILNNVTSEYFEYAWFAFFDQNWDNLSYNLALDETGFYGIVYLEFLMIGVLLAFGLAILILSFQRENKYFNGVLLARGFGRIGLLKLITSQISIIFLIGILTGLLSGFITSFSLLKFVTIMNYGGGNISFPLFVNILELAEILGMIVLSSFVIYLVSYYFESRKNITEYFHKF